MTRTLNIDNELVVGHVGRFEEQKKHKKLLQIFAEINKKRKDSVLLCVGSGRLLEHMKNYAGKLRIEDKVMFLGDRKDVSDIEQAFDTFVLPSLYEGLPFALIEAQANGLPCFASHGAVPELANITGNVTYIPLTSSDEEWAEAILSSNLRRDPNAASAIKEAGYDIRTEANSLMEFYKQLCSTDR